MARLTPPARTRTIRDMPRHDHPPRGVATPLSPPASRASRAVAHWAAAGIFVAMTLWVMWPLWPAPAARLESIADPQLNSYILSWTTWAIFHQISGLFHANIFWPAFDTLALGEHLLTQSLLVLPAAVAGATAPLLHNLSLAQGYLFSALAAYALAWWYWRSWSAALLAGLLYGFAPYRIAQSEHLQLVHGEFLPLMALGLERALRSRGARGRWLLGLATLGQWLGSWYWAVFTMWSFGPYLVYRLAQRRRWLDGPTLRGVVVPLALAAAVTLPVAWPYLRLKAQGVLSRPAETLTFWSARPADFLEPHDRSVWLAPAGEGRTGTDPERCLFPGALPLAGLAGAVVAMMAARHRSARGGLPRRAPSRFPALAWGAITLLLVSFAFGRSAGAGSWPLPLDLAAMVTPMAGEMRVAARWMLPAWLGIALLAAHALRALEWSLRARGALARAAIPALLALAGAELLTRPSSFVPVDTRPPEVYLWVADQPTPTPVLLLPADQPAYMLDTAWHRQPVVNGSNGYFPPGYRTRMKLLETWPAPAAVELLREMRVSYVVIALEHSDRSEREWLAAAMEALGEPPDSRRIGGHLVVAVPGSRVNR